MEHNENQDFEQFEDYSDEVRYDEHNETLEDRVENFSDEHLHEDLAAKEFDEVALDEVAEQTESARPEYLESVENNPYEHRTDEHAERGMQEELAEKSVDGVVLDEVAERTELAQPEYLDPVVETNLYEDRTADYAKQEMKEASRIEVPEDIKIGEGITEIDTEDAEQKMLEQSISDFGKNEINNQRTKKFDTPWKRSGPRLYKKPYDPNRSQKQNIGAKWVNPEYRT